MKRICCLSIAFVLLASCLQAQSQLTRLDLSKDSLELESLSVSGQESGTHPFRSAIVSFVMNGKRYYSNRPSEFGKQLDIDVTELQSTDKGVQAMLLFKNTSHDTLMLENIVPFGETENSVYITGKGKHGLSRTHLFIPGREPVNVIVPDDAWELGFNSIPVGNDMQLASLTRRKAVDKGRKSRFETWIYPGGSIQYVLYAEAVNGDWHAALNRIFQQRWLYDLDNFDNSLFERKDLQWIRHAYVSHIIVNWDRFYYDYTDGKFHVNEFLERGRHLYGGDDFLAIWPTWPMLGMDQRNQFDLFDDLPGGTAAIKRIANESRAKGTRMFMCYNPWDESTRSENHFEGISKLIAATSADGMVLDTKGESSNELQQAADKVRPGVIMYSEGMAVPKDMPGIPAGRVHNALYYPPMLNLNKLIKPEFAIFRVAELYKERIQREFATSFFNGYGTEMNIMAPGQPAYAEEEYKYLGRTSRILRENTYNFVSHGFKPLIETSAENIWVNEWSLPEKTIYTIYSVIPQGYKGQLFKVQPEDGYHFVDLWHHYQLQPSAKMNEWWISAETDAFNQKYLGTNNEGEVDCIAKLPVLISLHRNGDELYIKTANKGDEIRVWAGNPDYSKKPLVLAPGTHTISLSEHFGRYEGNFIVQLMDKGILLDENMVSVKPGEARRISIVEKTKTTANIPKGMVNIPAGHFRFHTTHGDAFVPYPEQDQDSVFEMPAYYMDEFPVTNQQFQSFLKATHYKPVDAANFLKNWKNGRIPAGQENFPVVYVSYEDARAYAKWAGKRLPTEVEWQYAAQTSAGNEWPWKQTKPVTRKEQYVTETLTVSAIDGIDSSLCNLGDGHLYAVGSYPAGANPYGLQDLTGCVWQLTNDLYMNGSFRYIMMKGGSYFKPSSSWWYVQGGPRELHYSQYLLRISQGYERNSTVGFRCVKDK